MTLPCGGCGGRGEVAVEVGVSGYGDPETTVEIDTCQVCRGSGRRSCLTCDETNVIVRPGQPDLCAVCLGYATPGAERLALAVMVPAVRRTVPPKPTLCIGCGKPAVPNTYPLCAACKPKYLASGGAR